MTKGIKVLHNDGHNVPTFHVFRDTAQLLRYAPPDHPDEVDADDLFEYRDANGDLWTVCEDLGEVFDHTKED